MPEKKKKNLLLVTAGFPYGEWERGFLSTEFQQLCSRFSVTILSIGREDPLLYPATEAARTERFLYSKERPSTPILFGQLAVPEVFREVSCAVRGCSPRLALRRLLMISAYYCRAKQVAQAMEALIADQQIEIIYTYWATEPAVAACLLKKKYPHLDFVTRFHGHDLYRERNGSNWQPFRSMIQACADRLFFACRVGMDYFINHWGGEEKAQLHYLGCGESTACAHTPSPVLRIVSCSNLIPLKRVDCIIDALSLLPAELTIQWEHFGDGAEKDALLQQAKNKLKDNVSWTFHGHVANHMLRQHLLMLDPDVFLTVSSTEGGVPVSIQEAFSMGIPCIGSAAGGICEAVIPGKTGFLLCEYPTPEETAAALLRFHGLSPEEKNALSAGALSLWRDRFQATVNAENFIKELLRVAES